VGWRPLGSLGSLLTASADRFDAGYYLDIARTGYGSGLTPRLAFLPLYPGLIRGLSVLTRSPAAAGMLISIGAFALALVMLHRLTELELGPRAADATVVLLCFAPLSFFFSAVYTESLFLALTVGVFYAARTGRWRLACVLAVLATLTRPTGFVLAGALLVMGWRSDAPRRELWWVVLVPAALVAWYGTLALLGHGLTGGLSVEHTIWYRSTVFPLVGFVEALLAAMQGMSYIAGGGTVWHPSNQGLLFALPQDVVLCGILIGCLVGLEACRRRMRPEYATYAGLVLLLCLATPERYEPLWSFDRFALTIFPLWMAAGAFVARRRLLAPAVVLGAIALVGYSMMFAAGVFIA
jgi:Gpi18-like mannosyltransferase